MLLAPRSPGSAPLPVCAARAVVSNASAWDTARLLPPSARQAAAMTASAATTPHLGSFMHLHAGLDAPGGADHAHHLVVNDWAVPIDSPQNVVIVSVPTVFDASLAPAGRATVHAYTAGNEPFDLWAQHDRRSPEYRRLKEERAEILWAALERCVAPDARARARVAMVGTPLTHARFLNRDRGTYGPAISAATGSFPGPATPIPGLYRCGDSTAPGVGVPAAAASGLIAANTIAPVGAHLRMLGDLGL